MNVDDEPNELNEPNESEDDEEVTPQEDEEVTPQIALIDSEYEPDEDENRIAVTPQIISNSKPESESSVTPQAPITTTESIVGSPPEEQGSKTIVRKQKTCVHILHSIYRKYIMGRCKKIHTSKKNLILSIYKNY